MGYAVLDDRNIRREFFKAYSVAEAGLWATQIGMQFPSDRGTEEYKWLGGAPLLREWLGGRLEQGIRDEAFEIKNKKYESTLPVFLDDLRRDTTGQLRVRIGEMASRAAVHWESLLTALIVANGTCYDGQNFFSATHSSGDSGTLLNLLTNTQVPAADVGTATAPTATEMASILPQVVQHMYGYKDDKGEPINQNATTFMVMVPVNMMASLVQALGKEFLTNGVSNPSRGIGLTFLPIVNPRLTGTTVMYIFRADGPMKAFIMQEEYGITTQMLGAGSDEEFKNDRHLFGIKASRAAGYAMWQYAAKLTLS
jgi:phage major head subunit gpT-like protein